MSSPSPLSAVVTARHHLDEHLIRLRLDVEGLVSTGIPDEWVGLVVPGQFQSRYYTVRKLDDQLTIDVVIHDDGLVTGWAQTDCVGDRVGLSAPRGSFAPGPDVSWVVLAGDLTALPAMARIAEESTLPVAIHAEVPGAGVNGYFHKADVTWHQAEIGQSQLATIVSNIQWPEGPGYFWMAGESAQMRQIRRHARLDLGWPSKSYDVMGYWSSTRARATRAHDPGPIYARGKAAGKSDEEIWADYDEARARHE